MATHIITREVPDDKNLRYSQREENAGSWYPLAARDNEHSNQRTGMIEEGGGCGVGPSMRFIDQKPKEDNVWK